MYFLRVLVFCSTPLLAADTAGLAGTVLDPSGSTIENARIECAGLVARTGADGRFRLPGISDCRALISASGFEEKREHIANNAAITLEIAAVTERVLVSAARAETPVEEAGRAANILSQSTFEERQFPQVADVLRELPGIHVIRTGRQGGLTQVFTRGAQRTGTLVMLDGMPVNDPGGDLNFAHFLSGAVERVEVLRGPESALFGAEAAAGVVQIFTRRGSSENRIPRGSLSYERGSFQTDRWIANLSGGSGERFDYFLSTEQFHTVSEFPNDFYRNTTGAANLGYRLTASTHLRGIFRAFDSDSGVPNQTAYGIYDLDAHRQGRDYTLSVRLDDQRGSRFLQRVIAGHHRVHDVFFDQISEGPYNLAAVVRDEPSGLRVPRSYMVALIDPSSAPALAPGQRLVRRTTSLFAFPGEFETSRTMLDYQGTLSQSSGATLFGYEFERQAGMITGNSVERNNHGVFLHQQYNFRGRVFLFGGGRYEQNSVFGSRLTPKAAVSVRLHGEAGPLSSSLFRVSAGRGITEPSLLQSFARDTTYFGNPDLRPERTNSYEAGLVQEWFGRRVRTEVAAFHNSFRDLIVFSINTWQNIDASRARGFEFSGQARLWKHITASGSYTRLFTRITRSNAPDTSTGSVGHELVRRPRNSGAATLSIAPRRWNLLVGATLMGERQDIDLFGVNRNPGWANVFASGSYRLNRNVIPFFRADNLLNSRYQEVLGYSSLSRTLRGGLRVEW
jgi:outer membrane cobalamin receptor